jgi:hypothetical protein
MLFGQAQHQHGDLCLERRTAATGMAPKGPRAAHELPVAARKRGRGDQKRVPGASGKNPAGGGAEKTIAPPESRAGDLARKDLELVA